MKIHTALTTHPGLGFLPATVPTMVIFKIANDALHRADAGEGLLLPRASHRCQWPKRLERCGDDDGRVM